MNAGRVKPTVCFLLSKDPAADHGGDVELSRLVLELAAQDFEVSAICLSREPAGRLDFGPVPLVRVDKAGVQPLRLLLDVARTGRSLVHARFDNDDLVAAIDAAGADIYVAEHSYMAESFLRSSRLGKSRFVVNTHVSESLVWRATRGVLGRLQVGRLLRDELRVARAADAVGTFDAEEAEFYRARGVRNARWMDITLPPAEQVAVASTPRRLVLMGTRDWPPNQEAFEEALRLWPRIAEGIDGAELCVIGAKAAKAPEPEYPAGVRDLGFVDDLPAFLGTCRAMIAPIRTGGGVRVKILDAARMGLPVVGTSAAVGSLGDLLGLGVFDGDAAFIEQCRKYLLDSAGAAEAGDRLYRLNEGYWRDRRPHRAVTDLLGGCGG
ncbi:glycosyltransferase [Mycolicibacterium diernhoferi]|uniref:Glycosyl transferase n=1 Tax=Mycolicibacterium diernhoferi TaxID=1801 RepID=A0A1Q4H9X2_9MYCO|nr:glycosyltransferase [Mycolicibacterium diernhoferi]OJZ64350.1 glycosyl transferase [Mycolicibacterium diernhoferi]OPE53198.1 glycosyl transferase [Mycolicibacterium diernhoferi]PEG53450.1 glycosyl transferase [Mycolicibacterium diernhoferi]QYL24171.1 glycosyltransferase family 4 protein [Mycolicibacterium diernhoferi]